MTTFDLYELKETVNRHGVLISFAGPFSHGIIEEIGNAVTKYLENQDLSKATLLDVFSIFIEQTQNVRAYALAREAAGDKGLDFTSGIVTIGRNDAHHLVCSGNFVRTDDVAALTHRLDTLHDLNKSELKVLYKRQLREERQPGQGGGLGLIDMSRKSALPLAYEVREINEKYCFFSLYATV